MTITTGNISSPIQNLPPNNNNHIQDLSLLNKVHLERNMCLQPNTVERSQRKQHTKESRKDTSEVRMASISKKTSLKQMLASFILLVLLASCLVFTSASGYMKRSQYHEQGLYGPKSYRFGYTTGDHKNPMERHETSDAHGHVKGWYSFVDAYGKHQVVHYEAHPKLGFRVHPYKSTGKAYNSGKRHYAS